MNHRSIAFDNLRGIAVLTVVVYHFFVIFDLHRFPLWGRFGVSLFFIISGFLIFNSYARLAGQHPAAEAQRLYWIHRAFRILPAYYVNLGCMIVLAAAMTPGDYFLSRDNLLFVLSHFLLIPYFIYQDTGFGLNGPYWTLNVEMLWYIAAPLLVCFAGSYRRVALLFGLSCLYLAGLDLGWFDQLIRQMDATAVQGPRRDALRTWLSFQLPGQFLFFAIGILLCKFHQSHRLGRVEQWIYDRLPGRGVFYLLWIAAVLVALSCNAALPRLGQTNLGLNLFMALVTASVFLLIFFARQTGTSALNWLGRISYSTYLWHFPLLVLAKRFGILDYMSLPVFAVLYTAALLAISALSYHLVEERGFAWRARVIG